MKPSSLFPALSSSRVIQILRRRPLLSYFLMAYSFTWLALLPYVLSQNGVGFLPFHLSQLALFPALYVGPLLSGFLMTAVASGKAGLRSLLRSFILWRVGWQWYLFAVLGIPLLRILGAVVLPGVLPTYRSSDLGSTLLLYLQTLPITFFVSGLGEEPGWRGFALPRMQQRSGPLLGTLILGLLWSGWHLPLFLTDWAPAGGLLTLVAFIVSNIAFALVITWVFNRTRGNLLIAILIHGAIDAFSPASLFSHPLAGTPLPVLIGFALVALLLIVVTRGRLGYECAGS